MQATNKRGNSLRTITGFCDLLFNYRLACSHEVRAKLFYLCDQRATSFNVTVFRNRSGLIPENNLPDEIKTRCFQALPKKLLGLKRSRYGWERGRPRPHRAEHCLERRRKYCSRFALTAVEGARV